jgi:hypothetical protein
MIEMKTLWRSFWGKGDPTDSAFATLLLESLRDMNNEKDSFCIPFLGAPVCLSNSTHHAESFVICFSPLAAIAFMLFRMGETVAAIFFCYPFAVFAAELRVSFANPLAVLQVILALVFSACDRITMRHGDLLWQDCCA